MSSMEKLSGRGCHPRHLSRLLYGTLAHFDPLEFKRKMFSSTNRVSRTAAVSWI